MFDLFLNILTPQPLDSRVEGKQFLQLWNSLLPEMVPERIGNSEPIRRRFDASDIDAALEVWAWPFLAVRNQPPVSCRVFMHRGPKPLHGWIHMAFAEATTPVERVVAFMQGACRSFNCHFACLHLLTAHEVERGKANGTVTSSDRRTKAFDLGITTHTLRKYLPDLYWTTVFGGPYVSLFGRDRLASCPEVRVEELRPDLIQLRLSDTVSEMRAHYAEVAARRRAAIEYLNRDAFFKGVVGASHSYTVPEFFSDA